MPDPRTDAPLTSTSASLGEATSQSLGEKLAAEADLLGGGIARGVGARAEEFAANPLLNTAAVAGTTAATWGIGYAGARFAPKALGLAKYALAGYAVYEFGPGLLKSADAVLGTWVDPSSAEENKAAIAEGLGKPLFDMSVYSLAGGGGFLRGRADGKLAEEIAGSLELQATRRSAATHVPVLSDAGGGSITQVRSGKSKVMSEIYAKGAPSIVQLTHHMPDGHPTFATGFVVDDGLIATNSHILRSRTPTTVKLPGGENVEAQLVARDKAADLALLRVPPGTPLGKPVELGTGLGLDSNSQIFMVGHPRNVSKAVISPGIANGAYGQKYIHASSGVTDNYPNAESFVEKVLVKGHAAVRDLERPTSATPIIRREVVSHTAPSQPGNSGSPIFDGAGRVIGVHSSGGDYKWATGVDHLKALLNTYKSLEGGAGVSGNSWLKVVTHAQPHLQQIGSAGWMQRMVTKSVDVVSVRRFGRTL